MMSHRLSASTSVLRGPTEPTAQLGQIVCSPGMATLELRLISTCSGTYLRRAPEISSFPADGDSAMPGCAVSANPPPFLMLA